MKKTLIILLMMLCVNSYSQVLNSKYDSKNHPKAKGVWATVRYPTGWQSKEGERPNIVQKFTGDYNGMFVVLSLQILNAGGPVESECSQMTIPEFTETFSDKEANQIVTNAKKIRHEEKPGFIYETSSKLERAGSTVETAHRIMSICYKNTMISTWCSPSAIDSRTQTITSTRQQLENASPLCFQYFNSLVLMDKY